MKDSLRRLNPFARKQSFASLMEQLTAQIGDDKSAAKAAKQDVMTPALPSVTETSLEELPRNSHTARMFPTAKTKPSILVREILKDIGHTETGVLSSTTLVARLAINYEENPRELTAYLASHSNAQAAIATRIGDLGLASAVDFEVPGLGHALRPGPELGDLGR